MNLFDFAAQEARKYGLDPELVQRQMRAESGGNPAAISPKGARGPMQLIPATAASLGVDIDDPLDNIRGGVRYLAQKMREFGSPELALAAYNAGPGNVRKYGGVPPFSETRNYVGKIMGGRSIPQDDSDIFGTPAAVGRASARQQDAVVLKSDLRGRPDDDSDIFGTPSQQPLAAFASPVRESAPRQSGVAGKAVPTNSAVLANSIVKGIAGVPDFVLNAPIHLWNGAKGVVGMAANAANRPDLAPNVTPTPDFVHRGMKAVGLIRDAQEPVTTGQRIIDWVGQGAGGGIIGPANGVKQLVTNAALGGASSLAGGAVAEATGSPAAGVLASLAALPVAVKVGQAATRGARNVAGGQDVRTGRILSTAADMSPEELAAQIEKGRVEIVPGSRPTAVQAAGNAGISQLKRSAQSAGADFSGIEEAQNAARIAALEKMQPGTGGLTPHEAKQVAGGVLRENYDFQRGALKDAERGAWQNPALEGISFKLPSESLRGAIETYYPGGAYKEAPALLQRVVEAADSGQPLGHPEVQKWRSLVGEMARDKINTDVPGRAAALAVKGVLSDVYKSAEQAGAHKFAVTGKGPFGPVFGNLAGDADNAVAHLLRMKNGEVPGALSHPQIGEPIDLTWGVPGTGHGDGSGIAKLEAFHPEVLPDLQGVLNSMPVSQRGSNRIRLESPDHRGVVRLDWENNPKHWLLSAFEKEKASGTNKTTDTVGQMGGGGKLSPATAGKPSIDNTGLFVTGGIPPELPPPFIPRNRNPRAYSPNLISPEQSGLLDSARFLTTTRKQRFETGPAKGLLEMGSDGLPKKQGAEAFDLFFSPRASQTDDIAALWKAFPGNSDVTDAMRVGAVSDLIGSAVNANTGMLSHAKLKGYTKARSGALKGLLSSEQMDALDAVKSDAQRSAIAESLNRVSGSDTAQKLMGAGMLENPWVTRGAALVPKLGPAAIDWLKTIVRTQTARKVGGALIDPDTALRVLKAYERQQAPTVFDRAGRRVAPGVGMGLIGNLPSSEN